MTTPHSPAPPDRGDLADALLLLIEVAGWFGAPMVAAAARTIRTEYPHLIGELERALESEPPPLGPTPPTAASGRLEVLRRRAERLRRRFGR
jgi:hypothetical protein